MVLICCSLVAYTDVPPCVFSRTLAEVGSGTGQHHELGHVLGTCIICHITLVLQRVETQRHLIHFKTAHGPAIQPAQLSAHLRRFQNKDLEQISFRAELDDLCSNFGTFGVRGVEHQT